MIESYSVSLFLFSVKLLVLLRSEHITKTSFTQPIDFSSCYKEGCFLSIDLIVQQPAAESSEYIYLQPQMISSIVVYTGKEITYRRMQKNGTLAWRACIVSNPGCCAWKLSSRTFHSPPPLFHVGCKKLD